LTRFHEEPKEVPKYGSDLKLGIFNLY